MRGIECLRSRGGYYNSVLEVLEVEDDLITSGGEPKLYCGPRPG